MLNDMQLLGQDINPGSSHVLKMDIARLLTRSKVDVPVVVERGKKNGPCLLLMGGIHGDEINGIEIVRQLISNGYNKPKSGTIICIPLLNVFGFINQTREFPDGRDLNRVFPGSKKGSLASRFAYHIMKEIIPHVDYCIDYHTGGGQRFNWPHIRISENDQSSLELAKEFGAPFIMKAKNREKTFRESMVNLKKKVLLFEGGKSLSLDNEVTQIGVRGAVKIIHSLQMRDFSKLLAGENTELSIVIGSSKWIRARHSGMFRSFVKVGQLVDKGEKLGSISDPFGQFEKTFKNTRKGYILNINESPLVNQGNALFYVGFE